MADFNALLESEKYQKLDEGQKNTLSAIMESTAKETEKMIAEGTIAADVAQFTPFLMPMLRRIYPQLIANEILGTQPLSGPTGFIYALTNRYLGNAAQGITGKPGDNLTPGGPSQYAKTNASTQILLVSETVKTAGTVNTVGGVAATIVFAEPANHGSLTQNWPTDTVANVAGGATGKGGKGGATAQYAVLVELPPKSATGAQDRVAVDGTDVFASYQGMAAFAKILPNFSGSYTTANGETRGVVSNEMNEVGIAVERVQVEAKTRKLRAEYTIEMYQDLKAMHGVLADQELMNLMGYEIKAETDREVVDFVNSKAAAESDYFLSGGYGAVGTTGAMNAGRWEIERYRSLAIKIADMSREIGLRNKRGAANKLLISPKVLTVLEAIGGFTAAPVDSTTNANNLNAVAGRFDNKFNVIVDNYAQNDYVTAIYKGSNQDALGVYAPYTPVQIQKVTHVTTGQPALIAMSRYGLAENPFGGDQYATSMGIDFNTTVLA